MPEPVCANCGSRKVNALADAVGCDECGAATSYDGELVHGPTAREDVPQPAETVEDPEAKAASKRTSTKSKKG